MLFKNEDASLKLDIVNYELPADGGAPDSDDRNWLVLRCTWIDENGDITKDSNSCLLTYELQEMTAGLKVLNAGIRAVREGAPGAEIMLHLDNGGSNRLYRTWFDSYFAQGGLDFDCIGLSYYPFWHGTLEDLRQNMNDLALRYHKDMIVAEVSMGFTMEDYAEYEQLEPERRKGMATKPSLAEKVPYPMTPEGQSRFLLDLMNLIRAVPENRGKGFVYWEPAWIPVPGCGWANEAALAYTGEQGPGGNEWANQALFDYQGNALPGLNVIREFGEEAP